MSVPIFKNSNEALHYGRKMDFSDWRAFEREIVRLKKIIEEYQEKGDFEKVVYLARRKFQFLRDAQIAFVRSILLY